MSYSLLLSPKEACAKYISVFAGNCSGFVRRVAQELLIILPETPPIRANANVNDKSPADVMTYWIETYLPSPATPFISIPPSATAAISAISYANKGDFVIAGATSAEINQFREARHKTKNGHVAVVTPGYGLNGWPRGYWGVLGDAGSAGRDLSLSKAFNTSLRNQIHYFVCLKGIVKAGDLSI